MIPKLLSLFMLFLVLSVQAKTSKQTLLNFQIDTKQLYEGDLQYSMMIISPQKLSEKYPELAELDSLKLTELDQVRIMVTKSAFIVNKPVGFFDHQTMSNEKFLNHLRGEQKIEKKGDNHFKVTVPGQGSHTYEMKSFFDSDDISTLPNSRVIRAVTRSKKLDVISGGASSIIFQEFTDFSRFGRGGLQVRSFIPLKENKTLVLSYALHAIEKPFAVKKTLEENFVDELNAQKSLIESYE